MDKDIFSLEEVAELLGQPESAIQSLLRQGGLVGRQINGVWYTTKRRLLEYIEGNEPSPQRSEALTASIEPHPRKAHLINWWECPNCATINGPTRVLCIACEEPRVTPLINYVPGS
jgi:hypothetical protein